MYKFDEINDCTSENSLGKVHYYNFTHPSKTTLFANGKFEFYQNLNCNIEVSIWF